MGKIFRKAQPKKTIQNINAITGSYSTSPSASAKAVAVGVYGAIGSGFTLYVGGRSYTGRIVVNYGSGYGGVAMGKYNYGDSISVSRGTINARLYLS